MTASGFGVSHTPAVIQFISISEAQQGPIGYSEAIILWDGFPWIPQELYFLITLSPYL